MKHVEEDMKKFFGDSYEPSEEEMTVSLHTSGEKCVSGANYPNQRDTEWSEVSAKHERFLTFGEAQKIVANPIPTDSWLPGSFLRKQND